MKSYTLSLSRWHKIADRLSRLSAEQARVAHDTLINTKVSGYYGDSQIARLKVEAATQFECLRKAFGLQDVLANIRQVVGDANARVGITRELAKLDTLNRRLHCIEIVLQAQRGEMVDVDELSRLPVQLVSGDRYDGTKGSAKVRMLSADMAATLQAELDTLRTQVYALTDRLADLNREPLSLELDDDIARLAGL